jgi:hypothetical protein
LPAEKYFSSFFSVKHSGNLQHGEKTQFRFVQEYHLCKFCCFPIFFSVQKYLICGKLRNTFKKQKILSRSFGEVRNRFGHQEGDEKKGLELAIILKRNTRLNLFVRLLIAGGVGTLFVVAVERLLSEAFVAHWNRRGRYREKKEEIAQIPLTVADVRPFSSMLPLMNDEVTFASKFHVAEVT